MRLFLLAFFSVYLLATSLVAIHMMDVLRPFKIKYAFMLLYIFLGFAIMLGRFGSVGLPLEVSAWYTRLGYFWMGLLSYMLVWSSVFMILRLFGVGAVSNTHRIIFFSGEVALCSLIFLVGFHFARNPVIVKHEINTGRNVNLRVVQISDNHLGFMNTERMFSRIVRKIQGVNPDILLITGDFLENELSYAQKKDIGRALRELDLKYGIWAVTGNHEFIGGIDKSIDYKNSLGIVTLRDSSVIIDDKFLLIGQEDSTAGRFGDFKPLTLNEILEQRVDEYRTVKELSKEKLTILMTHQISNHTKYENKNFDLVLSGHTHGGQFFPWNFVVKRMFDIVYGLVKRGDTYFYVSSGTGYWGPPIRLGTRSEIVVFDIR